MDPCGLIQQNYVMYVIYRMTSAFFFVLLFINDFLVPYGTISRLSVSFLSTHTLNFFTVSNSVALAIK